MKSQFLANYYHFRRRIMIDTHRVIRGADILRVLVRCMCLQCLCLQCFDAVGWAAGRASGL